MRLPRPSPAPRARDAARDPPTRRARAPAPRPDAPRRRARPPLTRLLRSGCVEVVGTIEDGACLSPTRFCSFGEEFDLKNYDDLVGHIEGKYKDLFQ